MKSSHFNLCIHLCKGLLIITFFLFPANVYAEKNSNLIVLNAKQIAQMKVDSMIDLLNQIPSIRAGTTKIEFNGFDTKEILVLLDGRVINDSTVSWRAVNWGTILVENIKQLEIIKGSTGGRYGDFSNGGVVKITTKQTNNNLQGSLHAAIGSANYNNLSLTARKKIGNYGLNIAAKKDATDGFRSNSNKKTYKIGVRLKSHHAEIIPILFSFDYYKLNKESSGPIHRLTPKAFSEKENIGVSIILPFEKVKIQTHFNQFKNYYDNPKTNFIKKIQERQLKQQFFISPNIETIGEFDLGIDGILQDVSGLNLTPRNESSASLYLGKKLIFDDFLDSSTDLKVKIDIKGNYYSKFSNIINKGISLSLPLTKVNLTFSVADFNTLPSATKRYYSSTTLLGNPDLKMEQGINYNFTMSFKATKSIDLSASLFYNQSSNLIKYTREGIIGTYENIGSSTTKGLQTDAKYKLNEAVQASLSYTHMQAINNKTGNLITYSPEHEVNLNLEFKPTKSWLIASNTTYKSTRYYNSSNTGELSGRYLRTNLRVDNSFSKKGSLYLKITNLFDANFHGTAGYPVDPLSFYAGIKYNF